MDNFSFFVTFALFIEAVIETVKWLVDGPDGKPDLDWKRVSALILAIAGCVAFDVDLFRAAGYFTALPWIGAIATGIIFARGANVLHDLIGKIKPA